VNSSGLARPAFGLSFILLGAFCFAMGATGGYHLLKSGSDPKPAPSATDGRSGNVPRFGLWAIMHRESRKRLGLQGSCRQPVRRFIGNKEIQATAR
jgi:hypothetical protein